MLLLDPREPISAWSHGVGMLLAIGLTWVFWVRCARRPAADGPAAYKAGKTTTMLIFGLSMIFCYGNSAHYHGAWLSGEPLMRLRRLDHVGIYVLIAGTYTPGAWSLMKASWRRGTLVTVWWVAGLCGARVWFGGILPTWTSTLIYLGMGWGVLFCYRELARNLGHRRLRLLPVGGVFYSVGAVINLSHRPELWPGVFGAHELFHVLVLAGSACHVAFMLREVIPARAPAGWLGLDPSSLPTRRRLAFPLPLPLPLALRAPLAGGLGRRGLRLSLQLGETLLRRPHLARQGQGRGPGPAGGGSGSAPEPAAIIPAGEP